MAMLSFSEWLKQQCAVDPDADVEYDPEEPDRCPECDSAEHTRFECLFPDAQYRQRSKPQPVSAD
jgi:hypothetical protein